VLMSTSFFNAVAFDSNIKLSQLIHEGVDDVWPYAVTTPENHADWIVMPNGDVSEPIYTSLVKNQKNRFLGLYKLSYKGKHTSVYRLKSEDELFVRRDGAGLKVGAKDFVVKGVNAYDLAYRTDEEVTQTFDHLHKIGVNTVRFWAFGDGNADGFQVQAGITSENRFKKLDYIIENARRTNIKLIPVLVNNWEDYGGKNQYLAWTGKNPITEEEKFYSDSAVIELYKNYINKTLSRKNIYTGTPMVEEPAILAWDIMNEPRLETGDKRLVTEWTKNISSYVKGLDANHLVMIGTEKIVADPYTSEISKLCDVQTIDICSVHMYLYHENQLVYPSVKATEDFLTNQYKWASLTGKPVILGEFGVGKNERPFGQEPLKVMEQLTNSTYQIGYNGSLIWNYSTKLDDTFGFAPASATYTKFTVEDLNTVLNHE
jgi:mannan endo-1,4-beta-mannosidase